MASLFERLRAFLGELKRRKVYRVAAAYAAVAFIVVQIAAIAFPALHLPLAAQTLVVVLVLLGFPIALVLTWAFEVSPDGVRRTRSDERSSATEILHSRGGVGWDLALLAVVSLVIGVLGWAGWSLWLAPGISSDAAEAARADSTAMTTLDPTRIAVLYFDDHSEDGSLEHVAKGLTEALIHELNGAEALDVVSRHAVKPFRDRDVPLPDVVRLLEAGSLVEGSVERRGERLSATIQLIDGETLGHLMSERVEARGDDPLALRDSIVDRGARLLRRRLGTVVRFEQMRAGTESASAWELFQRADLMREDAEALAEARDTASARRLYRRADSLLARVERLDPDWVQPIVKRGWLALELARLRSPRTTEADPEDLRRGIEHAKRALTLRPGDPTALALRGNLRYFLGNSVEPPASGRLFRRAEEDLRAAVVEDPGSARAWSGLAYLYRDQGRFAEARVAVTRLREADAFLLLTLDPDYLSLSAGLALEMKDLEEAERVYRLGEELYPDEPTFPANRLVTIASIGATPERADTAWRMLREVEALLPAGVYVAGRIMVSALLARAGLTDSAEAVLARARAQDAGNPFTPYFAGFAELTLGDTAAALDALEVHLREMPQRRSYVAEDWWFRPLRDHPRFRTLVAEDTSAEAQKEAPLSNR